MFWMVKRPSALSCSRARFCMPERSSSRNHLPIAPAFGIVPLPTKYRIRFGEPMRFEGNANDEDQVIMEKVGQVKSTMQRQLDKDVAAREAIFW